MEKQTRTYECETCNKSYPTGAEAKHCEDGHPELVAEKPTRIDDLQDKQGNINIDLKIIFDQAEPTDPFNTGVLMKSVIVADAESKQGDPTAYLDLKGEQIEQFKHMDKIRVTNAYAKKRNNGQYWLTNAKRIEKIEGQD